MADKIHTNFNYAWATGAVLTGVGYSQTGAFVPMKLDNNGALLVNILSGISLGDISISGVTVDTAALQALTTTSNRLLSGISGELANPLSTNSNITNVILPVSGIVLSTVLNPTYSVGITGTVKTNDQTGIGFLSGISGLLAGTLTTNSTITNAIIATSGVVQIANGILPISGNTNATIIGTPNFNLSSVSPGVIIGVTGSFGSSSSASIAITGNPGVTITGWNANTLVGVTGNFATNGISVNVTGSPSVTITNSILAVSGAITVTPQSSIAITGSPGVVVTGWNQNNLVAISGVVNTPVVVNFLSGISGQLAVGITTSTTITNPILAVSGSVISNIGNIAVTGGAISISNSILAVSGVLSTTISSVAVTGGQIALTNSLLAISGNTNITNVILPISGLVNSTIIGTPNVNVTNGILPISGSVNSVITNSILAISGIVNTTIGNVSVTGGSISLTNPILAVSGNTNSTIVGIPNVVVTGFNGNILLATSGTSIITNPLIAISGNTNAIITGLNSNLLFATSGFSTVTNPLLAVSGNITVIGIPNVTVTNPVLAVSGLVTSNNGPVNVTGVVQTYSQTGVNFLSGMSGLLSSMNTQMQQGLNFTGSLTGNVYIDLSPFVFAQASGNAYLASISGSVVNSTFGPTFLAITGSQVQIPVASRAYSINIESGFAYIQGVLFNQGYGINGGGYDRFTLSTAINVGCTGGRTIVYYET